jgi:hypothetical protein
MAPIREISTTELARIRPEDVRPLNIKVRKELMKRVDEKGPCKELMEIARGKNSPIEHCERSHEKI